MNRADVLISTLGLSPHTEGGQYREVYRSRETIPSEGLPSRYAGSRSFGTSILFLLRGNEVSRLHRLRSDEIWHFLEGDPLTLHVFAPAGEYRPVPLGHPGEGRTRNIAVVEKGHWFGASLGCAGGYALVGCTVVPGFDFADFELAEREEAMRAYPGHRDVIRHLTHP